MIELKIVTQVLSRLKEKSPLIQVILGPRQVGKTTAAKQIIKKYKGSIHFVSADHILDSHSSWISEQWQKAKELGSNSLLIIDEVQKINNWSEAIKKEWDNNKNSIKVVLLGSSSIDLQTGLSESLTGRFELITTYHWGFQESRIGFKFSLDEYLAYGGYPGSYKYRSDHNRWCDYIKNSIIETVISRDILKMRTVSKPALFRQVFEILCHYPAQEVSYTKILGQLQDKGNTDLIKHYLYLYESAYLFKTLTKFSLKPIKTKTSSPKILPFCPSLYAITQSKNFIKDPQLKGRAFELAVGCDLARGKGNLFYWRERNAEVDFVYVLENKIFAIEVKSGRSKSNTGLEQFTRIHPKSKSIYITPENYFKFCIDPDKFLLKLL